MADLIEREPESPISKALPPTWCVVACQHGCGESWTVDVADFEPRLTASDVERLLTPYLLVHEDWHAQRGARLVDGERS